MATTSIGAPGVTFPDATVQSSAGATGVNLISVRTTSGTWTKPATVKSIKVTVVGGGGPSGPYPGSGAPVVGGGGGGGTAIKFYPAASIPGPQPYTVGAAGATSSFGVAPITVVSATGGSAGGTVASPGLYVSSAAGGVGSNGDININGQNSQQAFSTGPGSAITGGDGGSSFLGQGSKAVMQGGISKGIAGNLYGGGASGSTFTNVGGGPAVAGGAGVVIIEEFY